MASIGPYYDVGTATLTVGSATVTGQSTNWLTARLRPGDQIESNAGQRATILTINSNTSITLDRVYAGTAQAAGAYKVWRTPDANELLDKARSAFDLLGSGSVAAWAGLTLSADKLPYGTGAGTLGLTDLPAASRTQIAAGLGNAATKTAQASDADATAGRLMTVGAFGLGSTPAMSIPAADYNQATVPGFYQGSGVSSTNGPGPLGQYGALIVARRSTTIIVQLAIGSTTTSTRVSNDNGATWDAWTASNDASFLFGTAPAAVIPATLTADRAFRRGNVLGAVSVSGGVPTGALIDRGSNANGEYFRMADGTQSCYGAITLTSTQAPAAGRYELPVTFAAAFSAVPYVEATVGAHSHAVSGTFFATNKVGVARRDTATVSGTSIFIDTNTAYSTTGDLQYVATGRWF